MSDQFKPFIISDASSELIRGVGAVDRTVFGIQEVGFWKEHHRPDFVAKWKGKAQQALAQLEAEVSELRKQVEAL